MYKWNAEYRIIDDFLEPEDLKICQDYFQQLNDENDEKSLEVDVSGHGMYHDNLNTIFVNEDNKISSFDVEDPYILQLFIKYNDKLLKALNELAPEKKVLYKGSVIQFSPNSKGIDWVIHNDVPDKLLSAVIYVSPKINTGTILYKNEEGSDPHEIEWKENRCLVFCRNDDTWHSYKNVHEGYRNTINWNFHRGTLNGIEL
jgi:hypothetical protein